MPLINISVNKKVENDQIFLSNVSGFISSLLNKSENFVMVRLIDSLQISFAGTHDPCCFIEIKSIGSLAPSKMSMPISEFISTELGISYEDAVKKVHTQVVSWKKKLNDESIVLKNIGMKIINIFTIRSTDCD